MSKSLLGTPQYDELLIMLKAYIGAYKARALQRGESSTQEELFTKIPCSKSTWHRWTSGATQIGAEDLERLCYILDVPEKQKTHMLALLTDSPPKTPIELVFQQTRHTGPYIYAIPPHHSLVIPSIYPLITPKVQISGSPVTICTIGRNPATNTIGVIQTPATYAISREQHVYITCSFNSDNAWDFYLNHNPLATNPTFDSTGKPITSEAPLYLKDHSSFKIGEVEFVFSTLLPTAKQPV